VGNLLNLDHGRKDSMVVYRIPAGIALSKEQGHIHTCSFDVDLGIFQGFDRSATLDGDGVLQFSVLLLPSAYIVGCRIPQIVDAICVARESYCGYQDQICDWLR
jgi:hypothetical protein